MYKLKEFNTITASYEKPFIYFNCENGMEAQYNVETGRYVKDTFSDIGQIFLDG